MASDKKVVVQGGGANLYKVSEYGGWFHAYHVSVGIVFDSNSSLGKTRSLRDALELIKMHSGKEIESIE
jgi:hypothetical protein